MHIRPAISFCRFLRLRRAFGNPNNLTQLQNRALLMAQAESVKAVLIWPNCDEFHSLDNEIQRRRTDFGVARQRTHKTAEQRSSSSFAFGIPKEI